MQQPIIPVNGTMTTRMLRIIGSMGLLAFILLYVYFSTTSTPTQQMTLQQENNETSTPSLAPVFQQQENNNNENVEPRPTINTITEEEEEEEDNDIPEDDSTSSNHNNETRHYGYVLIIASEPHQQSRRALIREKYFGLRNNLVPCMEYDTDIYYKFWIYGKSTTDELELESVEWNDIVQTNEAGFDQEKLLKWASRELPVTYDYLIMQDIHTFIHLPTIKRELDAGLIGDDSDQPYVVSTEQPLNLVWGSFTGRKVDKQAAVIGATAIEVLLSNQHQQRRLSRRSMHFLTNMYWYYRAVAKDLMEETDATLGPEEAIEEQARIIPSFVRQNFMMQWENNIESVQGQGCVVANVLQDDDFQELASWTRLRSLPVCVHHRSSGYYYHQQELVVITPSLSSSCAKKDRIENKRAFALRHGYVFVARSAEFTQQPLKGRDTAWGMIDAMEKALPKYKWLLWLDPKVKVQDMEQPILSSDGGNAYDLVMDEQGGIILLRNSVWAKQFLRDVQLQKDHDPITAMTIVLQQPNNQEHALVLEDFGTYTGASRPFAIYSDDDECRSKR